VLTFDDRINRARVLLEHKGRAANEFLNADIRDSWTRCLDIGLDPLQEPDHIMVERGDLRDLRDEGADLLRLAQAEIENLYSQISGSNFAIVFANPDGTILESIADDSFGSIADSTRITPGCVWKESINGTNALGGVVQSHMPSTVHAGEHFFKSYGVLTCVASPIFDPMGNLAGIIDASSDCRTRQHHTHALVKMSCLTIENGLFRKAFENKLILAFHNRREFLGTLQAGLLAYNDDGTLIAANRQAHYLLHGISLQTGTDFNSVFQTPFNAFLNTRNRTQIASLTDRHGSSFAVAMSFPPATVKSHRKLQTSPEGSLRVGDDLPHMVCRDSTMEKIIDQVEKATWLSAPIHIRGETGTGKEMLARFAHVTSGRQGKFIAVNCAALPESLAESELFGYIGGAFTGAERGGAQGLIMQADGGTLFLDEIGDMPLLLQATILRFLDGWKVRQIGGTKEHQVDIQLVTATNCDLEEAVLEKRFRADLLYRINTVDVRVPPLRERSDLAEIAAAILETHKQLPHLEQEAAEALSSLPWPGNIRELKNFLVRMAIGTEAGVITSEQVHQQLGKLLAGSNNGNKITSLHDKERDIVRSAYDRHNGNVSAVSRELGISRNTVYKKLKKA